MKGYTVYVFQTPFYIRIVRLFSNRLNGKSNDKDNVDKARHKLLLKLEKIFYPSSIPLEKLVLHHVYEE